MQIRFSWLCVGGGGGHTYTPEALRGLSFVLEIFLLKSHYPSHLPLFWRPQLGPGFLLSLYWMQPCFVLLSPCSLPPGCLCSASNLMALLLPPLLFHVLKSKHFFQLHHAICCIDSWHTGPSKWEFFPPPSWHVVDFREVLVFCCNLHPMFEGLTYLLAIFVSPNEGGDKCVGSGNGEDKT